MIYKQIKKWYNMVLECENAGLIYENCKAWVSLTDRRLLRMKWVWRIIKDEESRKIRRKLSCQRRTV